MELGAVKNRVLGASEQQLKLAILPRGVVVLILGSRSTPDNERGEALAQRFAFFFYRVNPDAPAGDAARGPYSHRCGHALPNALTRYL